MNNAKVRWIIAVVIGLQLTAATADAQCVILWKTFTEARAQANRVFTGTVVMKGKACRTRFLIDRVWKGPVVKELDITLYCDNYELIYPFVEGASYLVFVNAMGPNENDRAGWPVVSLCNGTRPLSEAQDAIKELGRGRRPLR